MTKSLLSTICLGCGCFCDDVRLEWGDPSVAGSDVSANITHPFVALEPCCSRGKEWVAASQARLNRLQSGASTFVAGRPAEPQVALADAGRLLRSARCVLIYGLDQATVHEQRLALRLARRLPSVLDNPLSRLTVCEDWGSQPAIELSCTWGELKQRADRVLLWSFNPSATHPRFWERYGPRIWQHSPPPEFDSQTEWIAWPAAEPAGSWNTIQLSTEQQTVVPLVLLALLNGAPLDASAILRATGQPIAVWQEMLRYLQSGRYSVHLLRGPRLALANDQQHGRQAGVLAQGLQQLSKALMATTRSACLTVGDVGQLVGIKQVMGWSRGDSKSWKEANAVSDVKFTSLQANHLLQAGAFDVGLLIATEDVCSWSAEELAPLNQLSLITVGARLPAAIQPRVQIDTAPLGWGSGGTLFRSDGLTLPLRSLPVHWKNVTSMESALQALLATIERPVDAVATPEETRL